MALLLARGQYTMRARLLCGDDAQYGVQFCGLAAKLIVFWSHGYWPSGQYAMTARAIGAANTPAPLFISNPWNHK